MKRGAQEAAGRSGTMHASRVSEAKARLDEAGRALRDEQRLTLDLPDTQVPAGRNLFLGEGMQVRLGDKDVFTAGGVDLTVRGPERIALTGPNGAGKTTLMRLITGELALDSGEIKRNDGRIAYLSQRLDLLDLERTVAENFAAFAPERPEGGAD
ncbi:ABC transporter ATP-binding protein OS=Streptomyces antimycoticus OX=68175 GN=SSPO_097250 PE=4 SV=1 [Streptomyces antimycoticus]